MGIGISVSTKCSKCGKDGFMAAEADSWEDLDDRIGMLKSWETMQVLCPKCECTLRQREKNVKIKKGKK